MSNSKLNFAVCLAMIMSMFMIFTASASTNVVTGLFNPQWTATSGGFDNPGSNNGDISMKVNNTAIPWGNGVLATSSADVTGGEKSFVTAYEGGGSVSVISVAEDPGSGGSVSEISTRAAAAYFGYSDGWKSANMSGATVSDGNTSGVTASKIDTGHYTLSGLSGNGNLFAFGLGNNGTGGSDNTLSTVWDSSESLWDVSVFDNDGSREGNDRAWSWLYVAENAAGVYSGEFNLESGTVSAKNNELNQLGASGESGDPGYATLTFGDGSTVNPSNYALFLVNNSDGDIGTGETENNLLSWEASGDDFLIRSLNLPDHVDEDGEVRFLAVPYDTSSVAVPEPSSTMLASFALFSVLFVRHWFFV